MKLEKITKARRYEDACATAHALDLVGERWALFVMRELMFGPKRFGDIRASLPGISANVLTQRLEGLEAAGIVERRRLPPPASMQVYALTPWGLESEPIFQVLGRWAVRSPQHDPTQFFSAASLGLSMRTMIDPARAGDLEARIGFALGTEDFVARLSHGSLIVARDDVSSADVVLTGEPRVIAAAIYGGVPLGALEADGALRVEGDRKLAERFVTLFPLPPKA